MKLEIESVDNDTYWDDECVSDTNQNYMACWAWGELKKHSGWNVHRLLLKRGAHRLAVQVLVRQKSFFRLIYLPHFPIGEHEFFSVEDIVKFFPKQKFQINYIRGSFINILKSQDFFDLQAMGFKPVTFEGSTRLTFTSKISALPDDWVNHLPRNRRKALAVTPNDFISIETVKLENCNDQELQDFFEAFYKFKKQRVYLSNEIPILKKYFGKTLVATVIREGGKIVSLRAGLCYGNWVYDFWAAHIPRAKTKYLSEAALITMINHFKAAGLENLELGGVDPIRNPGVYFFKKSFQFEKNLKLGEWSYCDFPARILFDFLIAKFIR